MLNGSWRMTLNCDKCDQAVTPLASAVPDVVGLLGQIKTALALGICPLLCTNYQGPSETVCFYLAGPTVYLNNVAS